MTMEALDITVKVLEGLSYLATAALLVVAIIGLQQIRISRRALKLTSKRDALKITNEQIAVFLDRILGSHTDSRLSNADMKIIQSVALDDDGKLDLKAITKKSPKTKLDTDEEKELYIQSIIRTFEGSRQIFNQVEAFASTFTSKLGDEKTAYRALGKTYCVMVDDYINILKYFNTNGYYKNTITLHSLWKLRLDREVVEADLKKLDANLGTVEEEAMKQRAEIEKLKLEISEIEAEEITSIGTDDYPR